MRRDSFIPNPDLLAFRSVKLMDLDDGNPVLFTVTGKAVSYVGRHTL